MQPTIQSPTISESCTSIIDKDTRDPSLVRRKSFREKRAGKKISKFTSSPISPRNSLVPAKDRRSANSNLQSGSSIRNRRVASPLADRTVQSSGDAEETVPPRANPICMSARCAATWKQWAAVCRLKPCFLMERCTSNSFRSHSRAFIIRRCQITEGRFEVRMP